MLEKFKPKQDRIIDKPTDEKLSPDFYIGIGGKEISEEVKKLPAIEVQNEVVWVNKDIEFPFSIEKGGSNRLGMFLTPKSQTEDEKPYHLEVKPRHKRSGILGRVVFKDKEGRLYRDVDLKGVGFTSGEITVLEPKISYDPSYPGSKKTLGTLDKPYAENDIKMAEKFLKAGIRTYRPIALIKLGEIIDKNGDKVSIRAAKKRQLIKIGDEPVVEVRAFGTRARIDDLEDKDGDILMEDAKRLVAQELDIKPESFTNEDYLQWFIKTMAVSLARMHVKNWVHGYLTPHNLTLDARIIDLDSVETVREINERKEAGENSHKSLKGDRDEIIAVISFLKEKLGFLFNEDHDNIDYNQDKRVREEFLKIYDQEVKNLKKPKREGLKQTNK